MFDTRLSDAKLLLIKKYQSQRSKDRDLAKDNERDIEGERLTLRTAAQNEVTTTEHMTFTLAAVRLK